MPRRPQRLEQERKSVPELETYDSETHMVERKSISSFIEAYKCPLILTCCNDYLVY
jgi:hypothetical protein